MAIDATVAGASADSYLSVADADALAAADSGPEAEKWLAPLTTTAEREQALKRATRELDEYLRTAYAPYSGSQALRFPRKDVDEAGGVAEIPRGLRHATYYLAAFLLANAAVIARRDARKARGQSQYSESNLSATEQQDGPPGWPDRVMRAISGFRTAGKTGGRTIRGQRIASGYTGWT